MFASEPVAPETLVAAAVELDAWGDGRRMIRPLISIM